MKIYLLTNNNDIFISSFPVKIFTLSYIINGNLLIKRNKELKCFYIFRIYYIKM